MSKLRKGYVQVYTGNGKGKTTAAMGLALRAAGAGLRVYLQQFAKGGESSEIKVLKKFSNIKLSRCGNGPFIKGRPGLSDIKCATEGWMKAQKNILSGYYDLVILDEINVAMRLGLVNVRQALEVFKKRPAHVELVLTGRDCPNAVLRFADLVTAMVDEKHPFQRGVCARKGIEY